MFQMITRGLYPTVLMASIASAFGVAVYALIHPPQGYEVIFLLPLAYAVVFCVSVLTVRESPSLLLSGLTAVAYLRYVILTLLLVYNGGYEGRSWQPPSNDSIQYAILLMVYELLAVILAALFLEGKFRKKHTAIVSSGERPIPLWICFGALTFSFALCALTPPALDLVSFVRPTIVEDETSQPPIAILFAMIFVLSKLFLCVGLIHRCHLYKGTYKKIMPWLALIIASVNIAIFFGSNRLAILLNAIVSVVFLFRYFGWRAFMPAAGVLAIFIAVFSIVTEERQYYDSGAPWNMDAADSIQAYTGGTYNVAIGVEVSEMFPEAGKLEVLLYDLVRPTIGLNIISKNWNIVYSNIYFNYRMFVHIDRRSQIMPMIAQSNLFFGPLLSPILSILFIFVGYYLLSKSHFSKQPELSFCMLLIVSRITFIFGQNTMNMMNFISLYLILPVILLYPLANMSRDRRIT